MVISAAISTPSPGPVGTRARHRTNAPVDAALSRDSGPASCDRALAEPPGAGDILLHRIGEEARNDVRGARNDADEEAHHGAARDRPAGLAPFLAVRPQFAQLWPDHLPCHLTARRRKDFAEPEQPDRDRHDADAVAKRGDVDE